MKKSQREQIRLKYNNRCAYCGCELTKGWHVDEILPCRRKYKWVEGYWKEGNLKHDKFYPNRERLTEEQMINRGLVWFNKRQVPDGYEHPERMHIDNQNPSCASCNINKHGMDLEEFRNLIAGFMKHLNEINTQYKIAKRYGLFEETNKPVVFYFETIKVNK